MDAILKLPSLFIGAYCVHICAKPPNPPAADDERARYKESNVQDILRASVIRSAARFRKTSYTISVIEAAIIVYSSMNTSSFLPQIFHPSLPLNIQRLQPSTMRVVGIVLMCTGAFIRAACYRQLGRLFTFELSVKEGHRLVTEGPYAIVRHPSYVGSCFFYLGACLSQLGKGSWLAESGLWETPVGLLVMSLYVGYSMFVCTVLLARVPKEDMIMKQEFQEQWVAWAKRTPYRLIPYVY